MKVEEEFYINNLNKIVVWNFMPFFSSTVLIGVLLLLGFSNSFALFNYFFFVILTYVFVKSIFRKYYWYKQEPCLKIDKWFYLEFIIYGILIIATIVHSAINIRIIISSQGIDFQFNYPFISLIIIVLQFTYLFVDFYCSNKNKVRYYLIKQKKTNK